MNKKITLVFENSPFADSKTYEGLRMGLGLTISNDDISMVFIHPAANVLRKGIESGQHIPDVKKALQMLVELKKKLFVLRDKNTEEILFDYPVIFLNKPELLELLTNSDIVIRC